MFHADNAYYLPAVQIDGLRCRTNTVSNTAFRGFALAQEADYAARRAEIRTFNAGSRVLKRGIALTPVKFGISFTVTHLNQAADCC